MAAMGEVVVLVTSQHVELEWMCDASASCNVPQCAAMRSNGTMGAISAGLDAWQKVLQRWDRCRLAVDGAVWVVRLSRADVQLQRLRPRHSTGEAVDSVRLCSCT